MEQMKLYRERSCAGLVAEGESVSRTFAVQTDGDFVLPLSQHDLSVSTAAADKTHLPACEN
jgi:hypothetical protein